MGEVEQVICPRCQASGHPLLIAIQDNYGVCPDCETTWLRGDLGQLIAVPARKEEGDDDAYKAMWENE